MLNDEHTLTLAQAARLIPGKPHTSSLWRWARKGVKSRSGQIVRLECLRMGGRILTSAEALDRFGRALAEADADHFDDTEAPAAQTTQHKRRTSNEVRRDRQQARATLERAGIADKQAQKRGGSR